MTVTAILGGGAGGCAAAVELTMHGHDVRLWNRRASTIHGIEATGLRYTGVLGTGRVRLPCVTTDLAVALRGADVAVVVLPALVHGQLFSDLGELDDVPPIVLNPGHTGGALHARAALLERQDALPPLAELSTLTYVARKPTGDEVAIFARARSVRAAALPTGESALAFATELFPAVPADNVLATSLSNVNLVLHPPGAVLGSSWIEATNGDFTFYVDGMTAGVARTLEALDAERRAVARRFGIDLPSLADEMHLIGTIDDGLERSDLGAAIRGSRANASIMAPSSLEHRYFKEDIPYGVVPFLALADVAAVKVPTARSLLTLATTLTGGALGEGLSAEQLGLTGAGVQDVLDIVGS